MGSDNERKPGGLFGRLGRGNKEQPAPSEPTRVSNFDTFLILLAEKDIRSTKVITTQTQVPSSGQEDSTPKVEVSVHFVPQSSGLKLDSYSVRAGVFSTDQVPLHQVFLTGLEGLRRIRETKAKSGPRLWASMTEIVREGELSREVTMDDHRLEERRQEAFAAGITEGVPLNPTI